MIRSGGFIFSGFLPSYVTHGLAFASLSRPLVTIYAMADAGCIGGGWPSSRLLKRGWVPIARKTAMAMCEVAVVPLISAADVAQFWPAVLPIGLAAAAHQGGSGNWFTLASDMFLERAVASVVGWICGRCRGY